MSPSNRQPPGSVGRWVPALAAGLVLIAVVGIGALMGGGGSSSAADVDAPGADPTAASLVGTPIDVTAPVAPDPSVSTVPPLASPLMMGSSGEDVTHLQNRLAELGFQPGPADGVFGSGTQQAVWAFKKLVDDVSWEDFAQRNDQSTVDDAVWQQVMNPATTIAPRRPAAGTHVEIYLPLQVVAVFTDNRPTFVSHISSGVLDDDGDPATFCETATYDTDENGNPYEEPVTKQVCAEAKSPGGVFKMTRYYDGKRVSPLGGMKNPWYFNYGIAIHGAQNVPTRPASHGCIRISNTLADVFPSLVGRGDQVFVWGLDGKEPEQYTKNEMLPSFNRPDPDATTTTSTTTTTTTTTTSTIPAPTTSAPKATTTTTAVPATTTTVAPTTTTTVPAVPLD